jgi:predicted acylesterase/phospholipase RssA
MRTRISPRPEPDERSSLDTAVVLSGGSVNGIYLQLGFLQALRASDLWRRIGWVYGTSAGALSGWATAMDALDEHEEFLMGLQSEDVFAANDIWRAPFVGLHRYSLPDTVRERLGDPVDLARRVQEGGRELTVVTTDVGLSGGSAGDDTLFERAFSSARETPETLADAIFASAAISTFVLPMRIGDSVYADGGWVRNFPLAYAYAEPGVETIVGCRYRPSPAGFTGKGVQFWHERMSRLARIKVARAVQPSCATRSSGKTAASRCTWWTRSPGSATSPSTATATSRYCGPTSATTSSLRSTTSAPGCAPRSRRRLEGVVARSSCARSTSRSRRRTFRSRTAASSLASSSTS